MVYLICALYHMVVFSIPKDFTIQLHDSEPLFRKCYTWEENGTTTSGKLLSISLS